MHDAAMLQCVASLGVPIILMHMRGNPKTMQSLTNYTASDGVVSGVISELSERSAAAEAAGIPQWLQVLDPGIGFAKNIEDNLSLLKEVDTLRQLCNNLPFLFGPSRKGFIGKLLGETNAEDRDFGTIAACLATLRSSVETTLDVRCCTALCNAVGTAVYEATPSPAGSVRAKGNYGTHRLDQLIDVASVRQSNPKAASVLCIHFSVSSLLPSAFFQR
eukprot:scaffold13342_cov271-Alexandrium_tamarense.AAC.4